MDWNAAYAGVKVVDLTGGVAGPSCAMMLGQHGADVIKGETPHAGGDWSRILGRTYEDHSAFSVYGTLGKRSVAVDLKTPEGKEILWRLVKGADVNAREKKFGQTALMWAAGRPEEVRLLLEFGADVKAVTKSWDVKYTIYLPTTVTLGKTGIPWNNEGDYVAKKGGLNALFFAVQQNDVESARLLLDRGLDVNSTAADGTTPLLAALYKWDAPKATFVPGRGAPAAAGVFGIVLRGARLIGPLRTRERRRRRESGRFAQRCR